jgi:uncharacterized glyoxalase superfamily protein PhnB
LNFSPVVPVVRIFDEAKAREFYLGFLGFTVDFEHRFEPGTPIYMGISMGDCKIHLSEHHGDGSPGANIRIQCDEVDAYCAALNAKHYKYYRPGVQDQEWGTREMRVQDGFGNNITFWRALSR